MFRATDDIDVDVGLEEEERSKNVRDLIEAIGVGTLILLSLVFINYALVNLNTGYDWFPYVAGPILASLFMISLIPILLARTYKLFLIELTVFIITTLISYVLTYTNSTVLGYESILLPFVILILIALYLLWYEEEERISSTIVYLIHVALIAMGFFLAMILSMKMGWAYGAVSLWIYFMLSLALFSVIISIFSERKAPVIATVLFTAVLFVVALSTSQFVKPDVTLWFAMAPVLCALIVPLYIAMEAGWE
ncbi:hypothetical protein IPA_00635 [Ignicoccus pacificus DSM 13166]|uniref:Uncharacterized protein n=1 Tax=Ignicoccus pacificus DSM 13166 TaxID=940294 RepID=A0A977PJR0_9CREN|nr:hypothetical protein IPA_00635 [Ignicoccus pacificus DSM 13166]